MDRCSEDTVVYIDLEIPKDRKVRSTMKLCMALGATLCLIIAAPQTAPVTEEAAGLARK